MERWLVYCLSFGLATGLAGWLTPRMRDAALRFGIVDRPDGALKTHEAPTPYLGGLAIYLAFLLTVSLTCEFSPPVLGVLLAGSIVVIVGLVDDRGQLGPWTKLAGQGVAVLVLLKAGVYIQLTALPLWLALPASVLWLLATTNAFNLVDVMDGLSSGMALVSALVLLWVADLDGQVYSATMLAALAGSCLGFLYFNWQPAQIYMGDAGALFLGLMLGALATDVSYTEHSDLGALAPLLILGVPLFDTVFVMGVRWRKGRPMMAGSPDHFALRLRRWRMSTRQTVVTSCVATGGLGVAGLVMTQLGTAGALGVLGLTALLALIAARRLIQIDMGP